MGSTWVYRPIGLYTLRGSICGACSTAIAAISSTVM